MIEVFRIEHATTHVGPFQTKDPFTQMLAAELPRAGLKLPGEDGLGFHKIPWHYVFGCLSLEALRGWFLLGSTPADNDAIVRGLTTRGFVLSEYLVEPDDCIVGDSATQVAFGASFSREEGLVQFHPIAALRP